MSRRRLAYLIAIWFGCGLSPIAPGTVGSLGVLPIYFAVRGGGPLAVVAAAIVVTVLGIWAADVTARQARLKDPQFIVVDEAAGTLIALAAAPGTALGIAAAVALFRLFDITKPFPARRMEKLPGGWGVMLDDVVAGLQAAAVVGLLRHYGFLG